MFSIEQFQHGVTCDFLSLSTLLIYQKSINDQSETFKARSDLGYIVALLNVTIMLHLKTMLPDCNIHLTKQTPTQAFRGW